MSFLVTELIRKKRDGGQLNDEELSFLVQGFATGSIPDYQIASWLMASFLKGLDRKETLTLTREMKNSGRHLEWRKMSPAFQNERFVDKHSTGGVGDKVSLILAPLVATLGLKVPMMSGRGLGFTGGTVDKLQAVPGFNMYPDEKLMVKCLDEVGVCMMAQANDLCPADKKLYALRDVTCTVENISLITASIVSKKWAEGVDAIVFDVKGGSAAFMSSPTLAKELAKSLVGAATGAGMKASALVTRMEEPLGAYVGHSLEVIESDRILKNSYSSEIEKRIAQPLKDLSLDLAAEMAVVAGGRSDFKTARAELEKNLENGKAHAVFEKMLKAQGAKSTEIEKLPRSPERIPLLSEQSGFIQEISSRSLGISGLKIKMGRQKESDVIDNAVGFEMAAQVGDSVKKGEPLLWMHLQNKSQVELVQKDILASFKFSPEKTNSQKNLFIERISHGNA